MADKNPVQNLYDETTCSICLEYFKDPVIIDCGHIFCQACIAQCCEKLDEETACCPQCREPVWPKNFRPVRQLVSIVEIAKKFSLRVAKETEAPGSVCERHQEPLKLFCEDDQAPICVVCDKSKEHKEHNVIPKEEAFEEYKGKIQSHLEFLKKKREAILSSKQSGTTESQNLLEKTEAQRQKIVAEFKQLHEFLEEQERLLLAQLQNLDDEVNDYREKHLAKLLEELSSLDNLIKEQEEKQKQPANEFLQDIRSILQRCNQNKFVDPVAFPPELKQQIEQLSGMCSFPDVKKCIDAAFSGDREKKANVLENMRTVPTLLLLKDRQAAWQNYGGANVIFNTNIPPASNQLHYWSSVLGVERITSGTHSWVVDTRCEQFLAVGVAKESLRGYNDFILSPEEGIWAVGRSLDGQFFALKQWFPGEPRIPARGAAECHGILSESSAMPIGRHRYHVMGSREQCSPMVKGATGQKSLGNTALKHKTPLWQQCHSVMPPFTHARSENMSRRIHVILNYEEGSVTFVNADNNSTIFTFNGISFSGEKISSWCCMGLV